MGEVDSVLSTLEVQKLLEEAGLQLPALLDAPTESLAPGGAPREGPFVSYPGGAGGYLEFVFRRATGYRAEGSFDVMQQYLKVQVKC